MNKAQQILSDLVVYTRYASFLPKENRRQTWEELVTANMQMHIKKYPQLEDRIREVYKLVMDKRILPSMRSLQFAGLPIEINNAKIYNCCFLHIDHPFAFSEVLFLSLCGTGVGFSCQKEHIEKLPALQRPVGTLRFLVSDSIEGWADAVRALMNAYVKGKALPVFDYRDIRPEGALIKKSGGRAPGHTGLERSLIKVQEILEYVSLEGRKLKSIEVHDIICNLSNCVVAGGVRESALISLFDKDDGSMIKCKSNFKTRILSSEPVDIREENGYRKCIIESETELYAGNEVILSDYDYNQCLTNGELPWYIFHPQRARANNSAILERGTVNQEEFTKLWNMVEDSKAGEPGIYWTSDKNLGTNPCVEIALNSNQFCNLTTVNGGTIESIEDFKERALAATFIGTLQAGYTDFHYLRPIWKEVTAREALLGVSITGIVDGPVMNYDLAPIVAEMVELNKEVANKIGSNAAARITCVKPEGSSTLVLGLTGSGVHPVFADYTIRRVRVKKNLAVYSYLKSVLPAEFLEDDVFDKSKAVISMPIASSEDSICVQDETSIDLLERIKKLNEIWIKPGHQYGVNTHNVSATIYVKPDEWPLIGQWMFDNKHLYSGLSVLPYMENTYLQMPFEKISKEKYLELTEKIEDIDVDLREAIEIEDMTTLVAEVACSSGVCEIK